MNAEPVILWVPDVEYIGDFEDIQRGRPSARIDKLCPLGGKCTPDCRRKVCIEDVLEWLDTYCDRYNIRLQWFLPVWQTIHKGGSTVTVAQVCQVPESVAQYRINRARALYRKARKAVVRKMAEWNAIHST